MTQTKDTTAIVTALTLLLATAVASPAWSADPSPATDSFSLTASLAEARVGHTATLLPDGRVLVVGGYGRAIPRGSGPYGPDTTPPPTDKRASAEIWDPATGTFQSTGPLAGPRAGHRAVLLPDGRVLVIGGWAPDSWLPLAIAEIWDPATGAFTSAGTLTTGRSGHTVTPLPDGRVLVVGGNDGRPGGAATLGTAEIWDPATGTFAPAGELDLPRSGHTATLLPDGRVFVVGGAGPLAQTGRTAEVWDPVSGAFTPAGDLTGNHGAWHTATLLEDGRVTVMGGDGYDDTDTGGAKPTEVEVWDPATNAFTLAGSLSDWRWAHQAVLLQDGRVLLVGGVTPTSRTEVWDPATGVATPAVPETPEVLADTVTLLPDGRVLLVGGWDDTTLDTAMTWDPATGTSGPAGVMHEARYHHTATLLPDGRVLVVGGTFRPPAITATDEPDRVLSTVEIWQPAQ
jgi:WD40 repeat protein